MVDTFKIRHMSIPSQIQVKCILTVVVLWGFLIYSLRKSRQNVVENEEEGGRD